MADYRSVLHWIMGNKPLGGGQYEWIFQADDFVQLSNIDRFQSSVLSSFLKVSWSTLNENCQLLKTSAAIIPNWWVARWHHDPSYSPILRVRRCCRCQIAHNFTHCWDSYNSGLSTSMDSYDSRLDICHGFALCLGFLHIHVIVYEGWSPKCVSWYCCVSSVPPKYRVARWIFGQVLRYSSYVSGQHTSSCEWPNRHVHLISAVDGFAYSCISSINILMDIDHDCLKAAQLLSWRIQGHLTLPSENHMRSDHRQLSAASSWVLIPSDSGDEELWSSKLMPRLKNLSGICSFTYLSLLVCTGFPSAFYR